jgi:glycine dehydrogenase subunit 2
MREIAQEAREQPELVATAPHTTEMGRFDEARAARFPDLRWRAAGGTDPADVPPTPVEKPEGV